jgi:hypothetical protein
MSALSTPSATSNPRVAMMSLSSIDQIENAGGNVAAQLLNLGDSAAGMVSMSPGELRPSPSSVPDSGSKREQAAGGARTTKTTAVLVVLLLLLVGVIVVLFVRMRRQEPVAGVVPVGSPIVSAGAASSARAVPDVTPVVAPVPSASAVVAAVASSESSSPSSSVACRPLPRKRRAVHARPPRRPVQRRRRARPRP